MSTSHEELGKKIERVVEEHIAANRRAAEAAVQRAFAKSSSPPRRRGRRPGPAKGAGRRTPEEIAALGERFYEAVRARPGEMMSVLSAEIGATSRELHRSVTNLKAAGRIRSAGQKHLTRYFPMV